MTKLYDGYHLPDMTYRRFGPLWIHMSESELLWTIAAMFSAGVLVGLGLAFAAIYFGAKI